MGKNIFFVFKLAGLRFGQGMIWKVDGKFVFGIINGLNRRGYDI